MKTITLATLTAIALVGCGGGSGGDAPTTTSASTKKAITYQNGNVFGETCGDFVSSKGVEGVNICEVGTGNIVGFVRTDATVTDKGGATVGECSPDFDISVMGKEGDTQGTCALSVNEDYATANTSSSSSSNTSSGTGNDGALPVIDNLPNVGTSSSTGPIDTGNQGAPAVLQ